MKHIVTTILFFGLLVLGACSDVEEEGIPLPANVKFKVESDEYYVQITNDNIDGVAFVYRWFDIKEAKYLMSISEVFDGSENTDEIPKSITIDDTSILTHNNVRELQFTNMQILEYIKALGMSPMHGVENVINLVLNFSAVDSSGDIIIQDDIKAVASATLRVVLARDLKIESLTENLE